MTEIPIWIMRIFNLLFFFMKSIWCADFKNFLHLVAFHFSLNGRIVFGRWKYFPVWPKHKNSKTTKIRHQSETFRFNRYDVMRNTVTKTAPCCSFGQGYFGFIRRFNPSTVTKTASWSQLRLLLLSIRPQIISLLARVKWP